VLPNTSRKSTTFTCRLEEGRDIYAVGNVFNETSLSGTNRIKVQFQEEYNIQETRLHQGNQNHHEMVDNFVIYFKQLSAMYKHVSKTLQMK